MAIDLRSLLGVPLAPAPEDPAAEARRKLEEIRAERARRAAAAEAAIAPAPSTAEPVNARIARDDLEPSSAPTASHDEVVAERCKRSLLRYVIEQWQRCPSLQATTLELGFEIDEETRVPAVGHIKAICDHIQGQLEDAVAKREDLSRVLRAQNLLINCPPRSLKTVIVALASAWAWIRWPWMQILYVSATPRNVLDTARYFRDAIASEWYQRLFVNGAWKIRDDQDALSSIGNTAGGARRGFGWSANILGQNADWLQIDDAHQMDDTQESIKKACEHYDTNISSRMNDPRTSIRTAIMQRAARGDFSDHVLGHGWFHLRMPAEFEKRPECKCPQCSLCESRTPNAFGWNDWREREGEVLHPRFTPEFLSERRRVLRAHGYAGQFQQRPSPKEGNQFKVAFWRFARIDGLDLPHGRPHGAYEGPPIVIPRRAPEENDGAPGRIDVDWVCLSIDPTGGSVSEDASALGLVGGCGKGERRIILGDYTPGPRSWSQSISDIKLALIGLANLSGWHTRLRVLVEKKALGEANMSQLTEALADGKIRDRWGRVIQAIVEPYEPTGKGDKEHRAEFMEPMQEGGLMFLLDGAECFVAPAHAAAEVSYVDEFAAFPKGSRDDRVDATSQMIDKFRKKASDWSRLFR